jgi:hypothetical protein
LQGEQVEDGDHEEDDEDEAQDPEHPRQHGLELLLLHLPGAPCSGKVK